MSVFLNGVAAGASLIAGALFLRFRRDTGDRLFLWFALAFWTLGVHWAAISLTNPAEEARPLIYLLRLGGFILILAGVFDKNRQLKPPSPTAGDVRRRRGSPLR
jgi:hypothetical protein